MSRRADARPLPAPADGGVHTPTLGFPPTVGIIRAHDRSPYFLYAIGTVDLIRVSDRTSVSQMP
ncbi:hypothetical protein [Streptomyces sp. NEAU-W12]|uniref:hypothetical protein n=1 Tax=Streptomyces sp. NEAU-W12 TaxID=2994668 RepID=UPI00224AF5AF|nr:hypothetical protein [Streptomyces sp. NEAU-W12]MCX2925140.1 hypothetical protein [Streptomyces sp. NEAU-W12]